MTAATPIVHRPREQLLARSGLAAEQDGDVERRDLIQSLEGHLDGRAGADDAAVAFAWNGSDGRAGTNVCGSSCSSR